MTEHGFRQHDHGTCIADAIAAAEHHCATRKLQFTKTRRRVLELLLEGHKAMGAYEILSDLAAEGMGSQPPVVYRALDFLVAHGFAHKIEKLNAYVACSHPGQSHSPAFMICRSCSSVAEAHATIETGDIARSAQDIGFEIERAIVEAEGLCPDCQQGDVSA